MDQPTNEIRYIEMLLSQARDSLIPKLKEKGPSPETIFFASLIEDGLRTIRERTPQDKDGLLKQIDNEINCVVAIRKQFMQQDGEGQCN